MNGITIYLEPNTVKFFLGLYACWTAVTVCLFCDWYRETTVLYPNIKIRMSIAEKINVWIWVIVTLFILLMWML